jgi:hypothetical protein
MLPTYNTLSDADIDRICDAIAGIGTGRVARPTRHAA